jgi:hypothetical protein
VEFTREEYRAVETVLYGVYNASDDNEEADVIRDEHQSVSISYATNEKL